MNIEILKAVKQLIDSESHLSGYITSGSVQTLIVDYDIQTQADIETSIGLNVNISFADIDSIGSIDTNTDSEYIFRGNIDIEENINLNRSKPLFITGLQVEDYILNAILNKQLPVVSGSYFQTDNFSKISLLSAKLSPVNKKDQTKSEFVKYTIEFQTRGLIGSF